MSSSTAHCTALLVMMAGCAPGRLESKVAVTPPPLLCRDHALGPGSFCLPALQVEALLRRGALNVLEALTPKLAGTQIKVLVLHFPTEQVVIKAKWRAGAGDEARKELAA